MRMFSTFSFYDIRIPIYLLKVSKLLSAYFNVIAAVLWTRNNKWYEWTYQHIDRKRTNEEMKVTNEHWRPTFKPCTPYFYPHPHGRSQ